MPLVFDSFEFLVEQGRAEVRRRNPDIDPTIYGSLTVPLIDSAAALAYSGELLVRDLVQQLFPQTAEGEFLERWGGYEVLERTPASSAFGGMSIPGVNGTIIPAATIFTAGNGLQYQSQAQTIVQLFSQAIDSLTFSGDTATATTLVDHNFASGLQVTIAGADQAQYNGNFIITATGRRQFTYKPLTPPVVTPATGTISASGTYASVQLVALDSGQTTNLDGGAVVTIAAPIIGLSNQGFIQFEGLVGGAETESDALYRERILLSRSLIEGVFTIDQVRLAALSVAGNTRAYVKTPELVVADPEPTASTIPAPGQVFIFVLRDNDANIIPSQAILDATKEAIIAKGALPSHTAKGDVLVFAPIPVPVDFVFTSLVPDTATMRAAVLNQLKALFEDKVDFEQPVTQASFLGEIQNTQDLATGEFLRSFSLSAPLADVVVGDGEIAILGSVTFP